MWRLFGQILEQIGLLLFQHLVTLQQTISKVETNLVTLQQTINKVETNLVTLQTINKVETNPTRL